MTLPPAIPHRRAQRQLERRHAVAAGQRGAREEGEAQLAREAHHL
jgi:hypothetical protein